MIGRSSTPVTTMEPILNQESSTMEPVIDMEMNGATITLRVGEKRNIWLEGNATTGFHWRITRMEGTSVRTTGRWRYRLTYPFLVGSGGYFQKEFEAVEPGITDVYFIYEPVAEPQIGYYFYLRFQVI